MQLIITEKNGLKTTSSMDLVDYINSHRAKGRPELRHDHFMKKVPKVLGEDAPKYSGTSFYNGNGAAMLERAIYNFPEREACLMAMSYSYELQALVYDAWRAIEAKQPAIDLNNPVVLRGMLLDYSEKVIALESKITADAPKVKFAEAVRNLRGACLIGDFAKAVGWGRNRMFKWLRESKVIMAGNLPYQTMIDRGLFVVIEQMPYVNSKGQEMPSFTTMMTGKGQVWLENKISELKL